MALFLKELVESLKQPPVDGLYPIECSFNISVINVDPLAPQEVWGGA